MQTTTEIDQWRTQTFQAGGLQPDKAQQLAALVRHIEDDTPARLQADKKGAVVGLLVKQGMSHWDAFSALFCDPSVHEPIPDVDTDQPTEKEGNHDAS